MVHTPRTTSSLQSGVLLILLDFTGTVSCLNDEKPGETGVPAYRVEIWGGNSLGEIPDLYTEAEKAAAAALDEIDLTSRSNVHSGTP